MAGTLKCHSEVELPKCVIVKDRRLLLAIVSADIVDNCLHHYGVISIGFGLDMMNGTCKPLLQVWISISFTIPYQFLESRTSSRGAKLAVGDSTNVTINIVVGEMQNSGYLISTSDRVHLYIVWAKTNSLEHLVVSE